MTIYAIAIATNLEKEKYLKFAMQQLQQWGSCIFSSVYEIPCREGVGADYWNSACVLHSALTVNEIVEKLKQLEQQAGRKRPSHHISLDVDLIAWGEHLQDMQFNVKKLPLADDVVIPLSELWQNPDLRKIEYFYPTYKIHNLK